MKANVKQIVVATSLAISTWGVAAEKPNIIYILADDMGQGDVTAYNKEGKISTPHIDRIAKEGMRFTDPHTNSSVCTPTRYGILTGRYSWRTQMKQGVTGGHSSHLINPERETVASFLKKQGYKTACFGKWHLGMDWATIPNAKNGSKKLSRTSPELIDPNKPITNGPNAVGFDYYFGISASLNMSPHAYIENDRIQGTMELVKSIKDLDALGYIQPSKPGWIAKEYKQDEVLTDLANKACDWIRKNADEPFFVYFPLPSPHSPIVPRKEFIGKSGLNLHGDFCMESDWVVGEVLKTLDELKIADNTIVIFTSDNGTSPKAKLKEMQQKGHYSSLVYRGLKGTTWEGGHRVPFAVRWPKGVKANTLSKQPICTTDLLATCAELLGQKLPDNAGEDSVSFLPALKEQPIPELKSRVIVHHSDKGVFAFRSGKWKLMLDNKGGSPRKNPKDKPVVNDGEFLLFDMENDAVESTNLASQNPEVVERLKKQLADLIKAGRSTQGEPQPTDLEETKKKWKQLDPIKKYLN